MKLSLLAKTGIEGSQADVPVPMDIRPLIYEIRGQHVILDRDLAMLYGVPTKALNQAVKRNAERFPDRFMFRLSESEMGELVTNCDRFGRMKHSAAAMCAFTEQGIAMLSSVLRSAIAVRVSIRIMDAFVAMRKALASMAPMQSRLEVLERRQISDQSRNEERFDQIFAKLGVEMIPGLLASIRKATSATNSYKKGGRK